MLAANAPGFIAGEELRRRSPAGLLLEIDIGERQAAVILHDEAGVRLLDGPRRREAARGPRWRHFRNRRSRLANFALAFPNYKQRLLLRGAMPVRAGRATKVGRRGWGGTNVRVDAMVILPFEP